MLKLAMWLLLAAPVIIPIVILIDSKRRLGTLSWGWALFTCLSAFGLAGQAGRLIESMPNDLLSRNDTATLLGLVIGGYFGGFSLYRFLTPNPKDTSLTSKANNNRLEGSSSGYFRLYKQNKFPDSSGDDSSDRGTVIQVDKSTQSRTAMPSESVETNATSVSTPNSENGAQGIIKYADDVATKHCPKCAETIRLEAKACRFCGNVFQESGSPEAVESYENHETEENKCQALCPPIEQNSEKKSATDADSKENNGFTIAISPKQVECLKCGYRGKSNVVMSGKAYATLPIALLTFILLAVSVNFYLACGAIIAFFIFMRIHICPHCSSDNVFLNDTIINKGPVDKQSLGDHARKSLETDVMKVHTGEQINDWSASLRTRLEWSSAFVGALYGVITLLLLGQLPLGPSDWGIASIFFYIILPLIFSLLVYHNIWIRQLSLPVAVAGVFYSFSHHQGVELYLNLNSWGLAVLIRILIGFIEANATTGQWTDFWRSFLYHPVNWSSEFNISSNIYSSAGKTHVQQRADSSESFKSTKSQHGTTSEATAVQFEPVGKGKTKQCPKCAEIIRLEAKVCRFCRYEFDENEVHRAIESSEKHEAEDNKRQELRLLLEQESNKKIAKDAKIKRYGALKSLFWILTLLTPLAAVFNVTIMPPLLFVFCLLVAPFIFMAIAFVYGGDAKKARAEAREIDNVYFRIETKLLDLERLRDQSKT